MLVATPALLMDWRSLNSATARPSYRLTLGLPAAVHQADRSRESQQSYAPGGEHDRYRHLSPWLLGSTEVGP
jgi:hypothetical protein